MEQAKQYLERYQKATGREDRAAVLVEYGAFLEMLTTDECEQARQFMQATLKPQIQERIRTINALAEKADSMFSQTDYVYGRKPQGI